MTNYQSNCILSSESVGKGHPDKICDQIAEAILDACMLNDPCAKVACEVFASQKIIVVGGEISINHQIDYLDVIWSILLPLGYQKKDFSVIINIVQQSKELTDVLKMGASDQAIVYGYATYETDSYLPLSIDLAHKIVQRIEKYIDIAKDQLFFKDMKCEVFVDYKDKNNLKVNKVLVSLQHSVKTTQKELHHFVNHIIDEVLNENNLNLDCKRIINPSHSFIVGGIYSDTGLTGRKLMVDTYGTVAKHGGGAFSGKDISKIDRTGAYFARYMAKNIVASKLADVCEIQISYGIGIDLPLNININTFNTNHIAMSYLYQIINEVFDFSLGSIYQRYDFKAFKFLDLAVYGHFGRNDLNLWWEKTDQVEKILAQLKKHKLTLLK